MLKQKCKICYKINVKYATTRKKYMLQQICKITYDKNVK